MSLLNQKTGVHHAAAAVEGSLSAAGPGLRVNPAEFRTRLTTAENHVTVLQLMQPPRSDQTCRTRSRRLYSRLHSTAISDELVLGAVLAGKQRGMAARVALFVAVNLACLAVCGNLVRQKLKVWLF